MEWHGTKIEAMRRRLHLLEHIENGLRKTCTTGAVQTHEGPGYCVPDDTENVHAMELRLAFLEGVHHQREAHSLPGQVPNLENLERNREEKSHLAQDAPAPE